MRVICRAPVTSWNAVSFRHSEISRRAASRREIGEDPSSALGPIGRRARCGFADAIGVGVGEFWTENSDLDRLDVARLVFLDAQAFVVLLEPLFDVVLVRRRDEARLRCAGL